MSTTPLPEVVGTPNSVIDQAFKLLQKRIANHGGFIEADENLQLFAGYLHSHNINLKTVSHSAEDLLEIFWKAICENFNQVKFQKLPTQLYDKLHEAHAAKLQLRDDMRRAKSDQENLAASNLYDFQKRVEAEQVKKTAADQKVVDEKATEEIAQLIHDYSVNAGPNRIDHTRSEDGRAFLKKIKLTLNGKYSPTATLAAVRACRWFDSVPAMQRALDNWILEQNDAKKNSRERQQQLERSGVVGPRGYIG